MVILNERANLRVDGSSIKAHHKQLPHLPIEPKWRLIVSDNPSHIINRNSTSTRSTTVVS